MGRRWRTFGLLVGATVIASCSAGSVSPHVVGHRTATIPARLVVADASSVHLRDLTRRTDRTLPLRAEYAGGLGFPGLIQVGQTLLVRDFPAENAFSGPVSAVSDPSGSATPRDVIGKAFGEFVSSTPGRIWFLDASDVCGDAVCIFGTLSEVDLQGRVTRGPFQLPDHSPVPEADVGVGLVRIQQGAGDLAPMHIDVWDPVHDRVVRHITDDGIYLAANPTSVVWLSCSDPDTCRSLHATDARTGADRVVHLPRSLGGPNQGSLSPDGTKLAVTQVHGPLEVVDLASGAIASAQGTSGGLPAWASDGRWVFCATATTSVTAKVRIVAYRPVGHSTTILPGAYDQVNDILVWR